MADDITEEVVSEEVVSEEVVEEVVSEEVVSEEVVEEVVEEILFRYAIFVEDGIITNKIVMTLDATQEDAEFFGATLLLPIELQNSVWIGDGYVDGEFINNNPERIEEEVVEEMSDEDIQALLDELETSAETSADETPA